LGETIDPKSQLSHKLIFDRLASLLMALRSGCLPPKVLLILLEISLMMVKRLVKFSIKFKDPMQQKEVAVIGAGGHAKVVASTLLAAGYRVSGFYDDDSEKWGKYIFDIPVVGPIDSLKDIKHCPAIIGLGDNKTRKKVADEFDLNWITVVHPFAWVHPDTRLGVGTVICAGAVVQPGSKIGSHVILNTKASVDHDCYVGDYVHIAVAHLAGGASADEGSFLSLGSTVLPNLSVGAWAHLGAGSIATKNIPPGSTAVGNPARIIKSAVEV
jgi:acetyltransferase EpsM